jgi:flagellin-like hook-associated protein FlgL
MTQSISSYGTIGRTLTSALQVRDRLDVLTRQASSGRVSETYGGLAPSASVSISLRAEVSRRETYTQAIGMAELRLKVMQPALGRVGELASELASKALSAVTQGRVSVEVVAEQARAALREVAVLLNTQAGDEYVFAGTDSTRAPIPNPNNILQSGYFTQIQAAVQQFAIPWDDDANVVTPDVPRSASQVLADTLPIAASDATGTTPFSAFLSTASPAGGLGEPRAWIAADDGQRITYGLRANENGATVSRTEPPSTGSFIRDIMRGLAMLGSLSEGIRDRDQTDIEGDAFNELLTGIAGTLQSAHKTLEEERGALGVSEQRLAALKERHADVTVVLRTQISAVEDVDMAEVASRLQLLQTQLEMSYQLISNLRDMNLARYL